MQAHTACILTGGNFLLIPSPEILGRARRRRKMTVTTAAKVGSYFEPLAGSQNIILFRCCFVFAMASFLGSDVVFQQQRRSFSSAPSYLVGGVNSRQRRCFLSAAFSRRRGCFSSAALLLVSAVVSRRVACQRRRFSSAASAFLVSGVVSRQLRVLFAGWPHGK